MQRNWMLSLLGLALLILWGCSAETRSVPYEAPTQTFSLEGPLFSGPNPAQVEFSPNLSSVLSENNSSMEALEQVKLKSATFRTPDGRAFSDFGVQGIVFQMVTDAADMVQVAVVNPIPAGQSEVSLTISDEAELDEIFNSSPIYLVADFDLTQDVDSTLTFDGDFVFDLQVVD